MKFTPKEIQGNINVSHVSPVKDFIVLGLKILGVLFVIYFSLGWLVDYIVPKLSVETETRIGKLFFAAIEKDEKIIPDAGLQSLLDDLVKQAGSDIPSLPYKVHVKDTEEINAVALPGGHIVVFSGLLKEIKSKNELAMVLSHELGHFAHRDHLRGLGKGIILVVLSISLMGTDPTTSGFLTNSLAGIEMKFSREQENAADLFGLELMNKAFNHVGGATDFWEKSVEKEGGLKFLYFMSTHPHPDERLGKLRHIIQERNYKIQNTVPFEFKLPEARETIESKVTKDKP